MVPEEFHIKKSNFHGIELPARLQVSLSVACAQWTSIYTVRKNTHENDYISNGNHAI